MEEMKACPFECDGAPSPYYGTDCKITNKVCKKDGCKIFAGVDEHKKRIAELERTVDDLRGELAQSDRASDATRIAELEAEREKLRAALRGLVEIDFSDAVVACQQWVRRKEDAEEALKGGE